MCRYPAWKLRAWKYVSEFTSFLSQRFSRYDVFTVFNSGVTPIPWTFIFQKHRKSYWQKLPCAFRERIQNGLRWYNYDTKKVTLNNYSFRKKVAIGNYCITIYCYLFAVRKSTRQRPCATKHFQFFSALNGKEPTGQIERRWRTRKDRGSCKEGRSVGVGLGDVGKPANLSRDYIIQASSSEWGWIGWAQKLNFSTLSSCLLHVLQLNCDILHRIEIT